MYKRILFIDFETRSEVDLLKVGAHRYCSDHTTEMTLISWAFDNESVTVSETVPNDVMHALEDDSIMKVAHNAEFDMCVCTYILGAELNLYTWFDTAYQASYYGYPRALKNLANVIGTTAKASQEELFLFSKPIIPREPPRDDEWFAREQPAVFAEREQYPEQWSKFEAYAGGDVTVMREAFNKMVMLPDIELFSMRITFEMNFNGVPFDIDLAKNIMRRAHAFSSNAGAEALKRYGIENLRSTKQVHAALQREGIFLQSLDAKMRDGVEHPILELRDQSSGAAFSKIPNALARICFDERLHGEFVGHGAHTGRWSSRGVQLQNWKKIKSEVSETLENIRDYEHLRQHMRLCLGYDELHNFDCADLSQIEARVVAYLSNCDWRMNAFRNGEDIYSRSAEKLFRVEHVEKGSKERDMGKVYELALGYGAGLQGVEMADRDFFKRTGAAKVKNDIYEWRSVNHEIVNLWYTLQRAWVECVKKGMSVVQVNCSTKLTFQSDGSTVKIVLPSGRSLYYRRVSLIDNSYGSQDIYYYDYTRSGDPVLVKMWGGSILENITQAVSKDILIDIMQRVKERRTDIALIGTVHDEVWYLSPKERPALDVVLEEMARPITWMCGLCTKGEGFTSDRYRK